MKPVALHFIEDEYHNYAIVFEDAAGYLEVGPHSIPVEAVEDHARTMRDEYPGAKILVEKWSGEDVAPLPDPDMPYPIPEARRVAE